MPWWGWLLCSLGGLVGAWILISIILFAVLGFNFWKSWRNMW